MDSLYDDDFIIEDSILGPQYTGLGFCGSVADGVYVRNHMTIELSAAANYEAIAFIFCDHTVASYMSPSKKWYTVTHYYLN